MLRVREPEMVRPFKIPGGTVGAVLIGVLPMLLIFAALLRNHDERIGNFSGLTVGLTLIALGPVVYFASRAFRAE